MISPSPWRGIRLIPLNQLHEFHLRRWWHGIYTAAAEEPSMMNLNGYNNHNSVKGLLDLPRKHPLAAAAKLSNHGSGFYSRRSLQYHKLQAI
ncbi:unnamed protein product [Eruca vesicaria subsp. sativa]|uniref:Uncharacterized protein n=1 Tax=Eruca vesicaria subsp. sativa TaxID=29727 RepID=A0ABC8K1H8_ERUVS|nr:unnamed protein product [Eruca vesicaria subsp. sativa]